MAELYNEHVPSYGPRDGPVGHPYPVNHDVPYPSHHTGNNALTQSASTSSPNTSSPESNSPTQTTPKTEMTSPSSAQPRQEGKQQATFLTKLYALLEKEENHHMIRWDAQGEHIIVEKPEQLAIHVLPSVYRQSRFASFSRQLNIYGFMRKVNLRNVDPAIDDPDASSWSHPTLNRHSAPDVVANFKRRVPPRIPKSKKRQEEAAAAAAAAAGQLQPRANVGLAPMAPMGAQRQRAFTSPGSFTPLSQGGAVGWGASYPRSTIPPLDVPGQGHQLPQHGGGMFPGHHPGYPPHPSHGHPMSPADDAPPFNQLPPYQGQGREMMMSSQGYQGYPPPDQGWQFSNMPGGGPPSHSSSSLNSLLNPSSAGGSGYARPSLNTYGSSFPSMPPHSPSSPVDSRPNTGYGDSRPNTGYSVSSATSVGYDDKPFAHDYPRPTSSHHPPPRQLSPNSASRPTSSHNPNFQGGSLRVGRGRRHSQAHSPYPNPYDPDSRPATSPADDHGLTRLRTDGGGAYGFNGSHGDFAYSAGGPLPSAGADAPMDHYSRSVRPGTGASSMSTASHASSQAVTPPLGGAEFVHNGGEADISRLLNR